MNPKYLTTLPTFQEMAKALPNSINWSKYCSENFIPDDEIPEFADYMDWNKYGYHVTLNSDHILITYISRINWEKVSNHTCQLSIRVYQAAKCRLNWKAVSLYHVLYEDMINTFIDKLSPSYLIRRYKRSDNKDECADIICRSIIYKLHNSNYFYTVIPFGLDDLKWIISKHVTDNLLTLAPKHAHRLRLRTKHLLTTEDEKKLKAQLDGSSHNLGTVPNMLSITESSSDSR